MAARRDRWNFKRLPTTIIITIVNRMTVSRSLPERTFTDNRPELNWNGTVDADSPTGAIEIPVSLRSRARLDDGRDFRHGNARLVHTRVVGSGSYPIGCRSFIVWLNGVARNLTGSSRRKNFIFCSLIHNFKIDTQKMVTSNEKIDYQSTN